MSPPSEGNPRPTPPDGAGDAAGQEPAPDTDPDVDPAGRSRAALLGAMFLMATSAIGPGFITQNSTFTVQLDPAVDRR